MVVLSEVKTEPGLRAALEIGNFLALGNYVALAHIELLKEWVNRIPDEQDRAKVRNYFKTEFRFLAE